MLDKQIQILSVDTGNFYSKREARLHWLNHKLRSERNELINGRRVMTINGKARKPIMGIKEIEMDLGLTKDDILLIAEMEFDFTCSDLDRDIVFPLACEYKERLMQIEMKNKAIRSSKEHLLNLLKNKVEANIAANGKHHVRELNDNSVSEKNVISVFDSSLTRTIGAMQDCLSEDFMVVQVYYFDVIKDLIYHGFVYKGEKYRYFTSSAGQIRTKKTVFIKESVWQKYERTLMCGLTIDEINRRGGNNPNKHLAYMALSNSATDVWEEFNIDKSIVVNDFGTDVYGVYDLIDDVDYSITRKSGAVPIEHTDGAGMVLPKAFCCDQKNKMVRLPWIKGLLGVFDYMKFIKEHNGSMVITDIYGLEHDLEKEDIQVIFTKSQFKMWKYYDSWEQYKNYYKQFGCTAGFTNPEEDRIDFATINYQMLQSLVDITEDEILEIAKPSVDRLTSITDSVRNIQAAFGVTPYNTHKTSFQKSIELYPDLLNDAYVKHYLREIKDSMIKRFKAGKLKVQGKYTFLMPDFYAACQHWFLGEEDPCGLLENGEVFCWLFRRDDELDCLRSPHLFNEHAIRRNTAYSGNEKQEEIRKWFTTDAIYTSCKDMISKVLQFDVDGDKALVVSDRTLIRVAKRNIEKFDIVPLYYNMRKAESVQLSNQTIYDGLNAAFTGSNIGQYSNNISKIWNSDVFSSGSDEEKREAINVIKLLCMENNFVIDRAKTLYMPVRPKEIKKLVVQFTKEDVPHFFKYAKDKEDWQVAKITNSLVNRLEKMIPNPRINCRKLGLNKIDHTLMVTNPDMVCKVEFTDHGRVMKEGTDPLIVKYNDLYKEYGFAIKDAAMKEKMFSADVLKNSEVKERIRYQQIISRIRTELSKFGYTDTEIVDILVKYLYDIKDDTHKMILWICYGDLIYENLKRHLKLKTKEIQCVDCGEWVMVGVKDNRTCRCELCGLEKRREATRIRVQKYREKNA